MEHLNLKDILWPEGKNFGGNCDSHLSLMEFAYNNNYDPSIDVVSFATLYGKNV